MSCVECGKLLPEGARFCTSCGASVAPRASAARPSEFHLVGDVVQAVVIALAPGQEIQA